MATRRHGKSQASRERLEEMIELLQSYRGWSQKEVAEALERNVHALVPDSGNPKLDLVEKLSEVLDWPIEMIVADLRQADRDARTVQAAAGTSPPKDAKVHTQRVWELVDGERWDEVIAATNPEAIDAFDGMTRAVLLGYRFAAYENTGRYLAAIDCCREGLELVPLASEMCSRLRLNLAAMLLLVGNLHESEAMARSLLADLESIPPESPLNLQRGMGLLVRGLVLRSLGAGSTGVDDGVLNEARRLLNDAESCLASLPSSCGPERTRAPAITAATARHEVDVLLGTARVTSLVDETLAKLDASVDVAALDSQTAEHLGWCCLIAARAVLQHRDDVPDSHQVLAILTNKIDEVAERLGHWALRERLFSIEHLHRVLQSESDASPDAWNLDNDDVRTLVGTMSRFPRFRRTGWMILDSVRRERRDGSGASP